jgi:hypothetical protein
MATRFSGLPEWTPGSGIIECETERGSIDLHNFTTLEAIELPCVPRLEVRLRFHDTHGRHFQLVFWNALGFNFQQDPEDTLPGSRYWDPEVVSTFYGIDYVETGSTPPGWFNLQTILGDAEFRAAGVHFIWEQPSEQEG